MNIPKILSKAFSQIEKIKGCTVSFDEKDSSLSIKAEKESDLLLAMRLLDTTVQGSQAEDRNGKEQDLSIRWNKQKDSDGFSITGIVCLDLFKSKVTLKDGKEHLSFEYNHRAFPLTVRP